jgi:hypothetical protein
MTPPDDQFTDLLRMLLDRIPVRVPGWTDGSDGDPGITLVALFAYLVDRLDGLQTPLPDATRAALARIGARLVALDRAEGPVDVPNDALERLEYFNGRLLSADDLETEQDYFRTKLRRLQRAALTVGVISGLELSVSDDADGTPSVVIAPGFALDRAGELIEVCEPASIPLGEVSEPGLVLLRYVERPTAFVPATGDAPDSAESPQPGRIAEGFGISISTSVDGAAVVLGRLARESSGWRVDSACRSVPPSRA